MQSQEAQPTAQPGYVRELLDAVPAGIIVTHQDGRISYLNAEAERLFGYPRNELLNQSIDVLLPDRFSGHHAQLRQGYIDQPSTRYMGAGRDLYGKRKDKSEFPLEIGLRSLIADGEQLIVATIVNITRRKQLEERLAKVIEASPYGQLLVDERGIIQLSTQVCSLCLVTTKKNYWANPWMFYCPNAIAMAMKNCVPAMCKNPACARWVWGATSPGAIKAELKFPSRLV